MQKDFSYPLKIEDINQGEQSYNLKADKEELKILKEILQVPAVNSFCAKLNLCFQKKKGLLTVTGSVCANLELISVISLEPFVKDYATDFKLVYDTNAKYEDIYGQDEDINIELPDIVIDGKIDLCDIAIEQLALVMEDYPKKEGETFSPILEEEPQAKENPFSALAKLKK